MPGENDVLYADSSLKGYAVVMENKTVKNQKSILNTYLMQLQKTRQKQKQSSILNSCYEQYFQCKKIWFPVQENNYRTSDTNRWCYGLLFFLSFIAYAVLKKILGFAPHKI